MKKMSFEEWMRWVDRYCTSTYGLSIHDLPDCCFRDWYDEGTTYVNAAKRAIKNSKEE